jgi:hypothetical protein
MKLSLRVRPRIFVETSRLSPISRTTSSLLPYKDLGLVETSLQPELEEFGDKFVELIRHTWSLQADALEKAPFIKETWTPRPICKHYFKRRCTYGKLCFKSHDAPE